MKNQPSRSSQPESLEQRLSTHPELRAKIEGLLSVVENAQGDIVKASEAEQRVFEEIRQLSQVALQSWAVKQQRQQSEAFSLENPSAHRGGKKNSIGTAGSGLSRS
jgi:hypothetical protein